MRIPAAQARRQAFSNKRSKMRGRLADNHLEPECWPVLSSKFKFPRGARIFTIGSCFARNIERHLAALGFDLPILNVFADNPAGMFIDGLNKYTPPAIFQELKWAFDILQRDGKVRREDVEPLFLERGDGKVVDMHRFPLETAAFDVALERRRLIYEAFSQAFASDVVVMTLGLVEAWRDRATGLYVLAMPDFDVETLSDRFEFEQLDYSTSLKHIEATINLLDSTGRKKHLITTSPVVMQRTFTRHDVLIANTYSKSVLRAVAGYLAESYDNVDYFPSYESVMLTRRNDIWDDDLMHVHRGFVARIVERVAHDYGSEASDGRDWSLEEADLMHEMIDAFERQDLASVRRIFAMLPGSMKENSRSRLFHMAATWVCVDSENVGSARLHAARVRRLVQDRVTDERVFTALEMQLWLDALEKLGDEEFLESERGSLDGMLSRAPNLVIELIEWLLSMNRTEEALKYLRRVGDCRPDHVQLALFLSATFEKLGLIDEAGARLELSIAAEPDDARLRFRQGQLLLHGGANEKGIAALECAVELDPDQFRYVARLGQELLSAGRFAEAEKYLRTAIRLQPDVAHMRRGLASALMRQKKMEEAVSTLEAAIAIGLHDEQIISMLERIRGKRRA